MLHFLKNQPDCVKTKKNVEKWLAEVDLLRFSERPIDEKPRESTDISRLPLAPSSFHTACNTFATLRLL
jgi:hypothetical protein